MAGPLALGALLGRIVKVTCPHCRQSKLVKRDKVAFRVCPHCHKQFADPMSTGKPKPRR